MVSACSWIRLSKKRRGQVWPSAFNLLLVPLAAYQHTHRRISINSDYFENTLPQQLATIFPSSQTRKHEPCRAGIATYATAGDWTTNALSHRCHQAGPG